MQLGVKAKIRVQVKESNTLVIKVIKFLFLFLLLPVFALFYLDHTFLLWDAILCSAEHIIY